jgi:uncharacterized protein (TIGR03066 family)
MIARVLFAMAVLFASGVCASAEEPQKPVDVKKAVVGKWETADKDKVPLEINADGTIKVPMHVGNGKWILVNGTYTIDAKGEIRYRAQHEGITLGGWYQYKNGRLVSAMGPKNRVNWRRVDEKK